MQHPVGYRYFASRQLTDTVVKSIVSDLHAVNWQYMYRLESCQMQADFFFDVLYNIVNLHAPIRFRRFKNNDKPWITVQFKALIAQRNEAFCKDKVRYNLLRNRTNRLRRLLQQRFYLKHVQQCKQENPHEWWKAVKKICGIAGGQESSLCNMTFLNEVVDNNDLASFINEFLVAVAKDVPAINSDELSDLRAQLPIVPDCFVVSEISVFYALKHLNVNKSAGSEFFNNRFLISAAQVLAGPICAIVNSSIRQGFVPHQWKISRVTPIPKSLPPRSIETDLRPISITSSIAKVAESLVSRLFNQHFNPLLDSNQFGCCKDRSTTHALIKICHVIFEGSDQPCNFTRVLFIDFTKAFDLINHNILHKKLVDYKFPPHLVAWSLSFLERRLQYVRIGSHISDVRELNAGVPQGTIAGPNDFKVLINDLNFDLPYIKYVDDTTVASVSRDPANSTLQEAADHLVNWCNLNGMLINTRKTKEVLFHFGRATPQEEVPPLRIHNDYIERVQSFKLLGVYVSSDLSWSAHVAYLLKKISKHIHIIYQLVRAGMSANDIIIVYCSIIRSALEYACPVWHPGLTKAQSDDLERVQRRCLKIIFPDLTYSDALFVSNLDELSVRRENLVRNVFNEIKNPNHVLNHLLPLKDNDLRFVNTRDTYPYSLPRCRTERCSRSFIFYCIKKRY